MDLFKTLPSRILPGSAVDCKPHGQQQKKKDKQLFPQVPGASGWYIVLMWPCILIKFNNYLIQNMQTPWNTLD